MLRMTSAKKTAVESVSQKAEAMIAELHRSGLTTRRIQNQLKKALGEKVTLKAITRRKARLETEIGTKKLFKKKGADIVRKFLDTVKEGGDVGDIQAVLEQAVYFDCLRRYADDEDGFLQDVNTKELLKITHDYQKVRLRKALSPNSSNGERFAFSPAHAIELLQVVEESFADSPSLKAAFAKRREGVMKKIKPMFDRDEFETATEDFEQMQKIREKYEQSKSDNGIRKRSNSRATA